MPDDEVDKEFSEIMRGLALDRPDVRETMEFISPDYGSDATSLLAEYFGLSAEDLPRDEETEQDPGTDS